MNIELFRYKTEKTDFERMRFFHPKMTLKEYRQIVDEQQELINTAKAIG